MTQEASASEIDATPETAPDAGGAHGTDSPGPTAPLTWMRLRRSLNRSSDERVLSGLGGGLGAALRIPTPYVRAGFVSLAFAGGAGAVLYGMGWVLASATVPTAYVSRDLDDRRTLGLGLMFLAALLTLRAGGLWLGDIVVWPVTLVAFGVAAIWDRSGVLPGNLASGGGPGRLRVLSGAILMLGGIAVLLSRLDAMRNLGAIVIAIAITAAGFMLVFGPWVVKLASELATERADRIRSEERADVAAHLHDSVLQTLALIQRSDDPRRMVTLARSQERELRTWLYGGPAGADSTLAAELQAAAGRVEQVHDVPVEVVVVSDMEMTGRLEPVVAAAAEAMHNAARHSGAARVSVYAEVMEGSLDVFVSDQGSGFDPDAVPDDRHGLRNSIIGRMERHGGTATVHSEPGDGTEIHLGMSLETS